MRVLKTEGSDQEDWIPRLCTHRDQPYAILSHRWLEDPNDEILFQDIQEIDSSDSHVRVVNNAQYTDNNARSKPGFKKLKGAVEQARKGDYEYIWIDTCCIDKSSSVELSEAINSMFKWYAASDICYVYLMDVSEAPDLSKDLPTGSPFAESQWWKRGWTLQELLAPHKLTFFTEYWVAIGDKKSMGDIIYGITGISTDAIEGRDLDTFSVAQRMSWASGRITTRPEDVAYCLMGLFDVNMPVLYGEGEKAFTRLQQEIIKESDDESIFAWRDEPVLSESYSGMLATSPSAFANSHNIDILYQIDGKEPFSMTNKGLSITLPLHQAPISMCGQDGIFAALLKCTTTEADTGPKPMAIFLKKLSSNGSKYARWKSQHLIEDVDRTFQNLTRVYVKQSWGGYLGFQGIFEMVIDIDPEILSRQD